MKRDVIVYAICLSLVLVLSSISVLADDERSKTTIDERTKVKLDNSGMMESKTRVVDEEGNEREVRIKIEEKEEHGKMMNRLRVKDVEAESELEIEEEMEKNMSKIHVKLHDGRKQEIKVMPDRAAAIAIERLKSLNFTVELREVGIGNGSSRALYFIEANKTGRFLGIIRMKMKLDAEIDPETGEIIRVNKAWWSFLVSGEDDDETHDKVVLCHIPPGDPASAHTITVGAPAMRAHLVHGDTLGACETPAQNNTEPPQNTTGQNTTNQNIAVNVNAGLGINPTG